MVVLCLFLPGAARVRGARLADRCGAARGAGAVRGLGAAAGVWSARGRRHALVGHPDGQKCPHRLSAHRRAHGALARVRHGAAADLLCGRSHPPGHARHHVVSARERRVRAHGHVLRRGGHDGRRVHDGGGLHGRVAGAGRRRGLVGCLFGDRCSPVSTSALLISELTHTDIYDNLRAMVRTAFVPFALTCAVYAVLGAMAHGGRGGARRARAVCACARCTGLPCCRRCSSSCSRRCMCTSAGSCARASRRRSRCA